MAIIRTNLVTRIIALRACERDAMTDGTKCRVYCARYNRTL